jgi:hypothetical protein
VSARSELPSRQTTRPYRSPRAGEEFGRRRASAGPGLVAAFLGLAALTACGGRSSFFLDAVGAGGTDLPCAPDAAVDPAAGCGMAAPPVSSPPPLVSENDAGLTAPDASPSPDGGIDLSTACLVSENKLVIEGNDFIYAGPPLVIEGGGGWAMWVAADGEGWPSYVQIVAGEFALKFSTISRNTPLAVGLYTGAQAPSSISDAPGLSIESGDRACDIDTGQFQILQVALTPSDSTGDAGSVQSFTATFEHYCDDAPTPEVGCVHVSALE